MKRFNFVLFSYVFLMFFIPLSHAGHLFTQASANTPINLTTGKGLVITQLTYEGGGGAGTVNIYFGGDWESGDVLQVAIAGYTQTFDYDNPLTGTSQSGGSLNVNDPVLSGLALDLDGSQSWTVQAIAGDFTLEGYRIYTGNETLNGTGADTITQDQVVDASELGGGGVFQPVANNTNSNTASVLDTANGDSSTSAKMQAVIDEMAALSVPERQQVLQKVAPETSVALSQASSQTASAGLDTIQIRLDSMRHGDSAANRLSTINHSEDADHSTGMASGDPVQPNRHFWIKGFGGEADQDGNSDFAGYESNIHGMAFGTDYELQNGLILGLAYTYAFTDVDMTDFRDGDGSEIDTHQVTLYSSYNFSRWYLEGMVSYALQQYESLRNTGTSDGIAEGDYDGNQLAVRSTAGYPIAFNNTYRITPTLGVEWVSFDTDSYTETGATAVAYHVDSAQSYRLRSILGATLSADYNYGDSIKLRPAIYTRWRHDFRDDSLDSTTTFVGGGSVFTTEGQEVNDDLYMLGISVLALSDKGASAAFLVESEAASGYRSYSAQIMANWLF